MKQQWLENTVPANPSSHASQVSERQELWVDLAGERLVDSVLERAGATSSAATLKRRSSADIARQVRFSPART